MRSSTLILTFSWVLLLGCSSEKPQDDLGSIDIHRQQTAKNEVFVKSKSEEEIKNEYYRYIENSNAQDKSRRLAMNRLTEIEINKINALAKSEASVSLNDDAQYLNSLQKAKKLIEQSLKDYPNAADNDQYLYQLARLSDQLGEQEQSIAALKEITQKYPKSLHLSEAEFRIGEYEFMKGNYLPAEAAYSSAIIASNAEEFYERSLFKRGWTRFKQALFPEAADDYLAALEKHNFADYDKLSQAEKNQYDEYFRGLGLSLASLQNNNEMQDYVKEKVDPKYIYTCYKAVAATYLEQERYSDAAETIDQYIKNYPASDQIVFAQLTILEIWQQGKFKQRFADALAHVYETYNPKAPYWINHPNSSAQEKVSPALREYLLTAATSFQDDYQTSQNSKSLELAKLWYDRYLEHYSGFAQKDKVYSTYADLLTDNGKGEDGLKYYELAAYDGDIILNKEAAYATITETSQLFAKNPKDMSLLKKHIRYVLLSAQLYKSEPRYQTALLHAQELALKNNLPKESLLLAEHLVDSASEQTLYEASQLKGLAYIQLNDFKQAEIIFSDLSKSAVKSNDSKQLHDNLALAIYKQAEAETNEGLFDKGMQDYARVPKSSPDSDIAPKALYEAILLAMEHEKWGFAISCIQDFQQHYPQHTLNKDVTRQLSIAYLNAGDNIKAAQVFEKMSGQEDDQDVKMASLWKAAELYETKGNIDNAIKAYSNYAETYSRPYPQYIEAMYKLTQLFQANNQIDKAYQWREKILSADKLASKSIKSDRTNFIVSTISLNNAIRIRDQFEAMKLTEPLAESLKNKKKFMQDAIAAFSQVSVSNDSGVITQATYEMGSIYQHFSGALLTSERPKNLKGEELEQYNILLEDQAFPFEEKAIEFYELNLSHTKEGVSNKWIAQSLQNLNKLYPVKYNRTGKTDVY